MENNKSPFEIFELLKDKYMTYLKTRDNFKLPSLNKEREILIKGGLLHQEPYLEYIAKYKFTGNTLKQDIINVLNDTDLYKFIAYKDSLFPQVPQKYDDKDFKPYELYLHQKQALEHKDKHIIVTSGTGSGKTETFLLPVIENILNESKNWLEHSVCKTENWKKLKDAKNMDNAYQREGENRPAAIRAMILYPLNALVEDQLIRLRKTFDSEDARKFLEENRKGNLIYFGRYNSSTPKAGGINQQKMQALYKELRKVNESQNAQYYNRNGEPTDNGKYFMQKLDGAEMYSRWDMQKYPPDILITNYSMLNVMLMRKIEKDIFGETKKWLENNPDAKFQLVIDELHSYRGTAGTEIAYLIRMLLERIGLNPDSPKLQILASSASLGEDDEDSKKFLKEFFGCSDSEKFKIIKGEIETPDSNDKNDLRNLFFDKDGKSNGKYIANAIRIN